MWVALFFCSHRRPLLLASAQEQPAFCFGCGLQTNSNIRNTGIQSKWTHNLKALIEPTVIEDPTTILTPIDTDILERLVNERSLSRWEGNYTRADELRDEIHQIILPPGYEVWMEDIPRKLGGGTNWKLVLCQADTPLEVLPGPLVLQLAHAALGLAVETSVQLNLERAKRTMVGEIIEAVPATTPARNDDEKTESLQSIVHQTKERLQHASVQYELGGRKAADAAFWFALAGVQDASLFDSLRDLATLELQRFGERPSCRAKDVYQILERLAAAGIRVRADDDQLLDVARKCLSLKSSKEADASVNADNTALLDFHSDRSLLLIWKFSTKQKKQRAFLQSAIRHWERHEKNSVSKSIQQKEEEPGIVDKHVDDCSLQPQPPVEWDKVFADPTRPLVVDIGSGMGVSLLGLATCGDCASAELLLQHDQLSTSWSDYNFCGVDLGGLGIGYARGLASRWGVEDRLHFVVDSAENFVSMVEETYPGPIRLCLVQFPTPYRLQKEEDGSGNSQLPTSAQDGFMVSTELLLLIRKMLAKTQGKLLLQSNCEDVAVWMRSKALSMEGGYSLLTKPELQPDPKAPPVAPRIPQRTADWIAMGGERADGPGWYNNPLLPRQGATETEVACILNGTPVHRCVLMPELESEEGY